jgi:hypothetical protein
LLQGCGHRRGCFAASNDDYAVDSAKQNLLVARPQQLAGDVDKLWNQPTGVDGVDAGAPNPQGVGTQLVGIAKHEGQEGRRRAGQPI